MRPRRALGFLERHSLGRSIAPIPRCRAACGTSTAIRRPNSPSVRLGRQLISSGWTASPRSPGVSIIPTVSQKPGTLELRELSLALRTPNGLVLLVGCSHPGIETIVEASTRVADHVYLILGGLHLVITPDAVATRVAMALHDHWHVDRIGPGHCTGEPAFAALQRVFGTQYGYAV